MCMYKDIVYIYTLHSSPLRRKLKRNYDNEEYNNYKNHTIIKKGTTKTTIMISTLSKFFNLTLSLRVSLLVQLGEMTF